jgi:hypothetical protein
VSETSDTCTWCGVVVAQDDGFRAAEPERDGHATFCRLEHVVPWFMQGARWEAGVERVGEVVEGDALTDSDASMALGLCVHCGATLGPRRVLLVRHRAHHRIGDAFCGLEHLAEWAKRGGRWQARS